MSVVAPELRDIPGDPGLVETGLVGEHGPYVGARHAGPLEHFTNEPRLDRVLLELQAGFGPQRWWPARTPYEVLIGAVLTQNTSWRNVERALAGMRAAKVMSPAAILAREGAELEALVRPSGTFRAKARKLCELSRWYLDRDGLEHLSSAPLEEVRTDLLGVWGIGPETADSILCYAAGRRTPVVDAYARRVLGRHGFGAAELPYADLRRWLMDVLIDSQPVYEEFHALCVRVGYHHCKPSPRCAECPATAPA